MRISFTKLFSLLRASYTENPFYHKRLDKDPSDLDYNLEEIDYQAIDRQARLSANNLTRDLKEVSGLKEYLAECLKEEFEDVYILGRSKLDSYGISAPMLFKDHESIERYLNLSYSHIKGFQIEILKHADWHGAGLIKITTAHNEILFRTFVSKVYDYGEK